MKREREEKQGKREKLVKQRRKLKRKKRRRKLLPSKEQIRKRNLRLHNEMIKVSTSIE